MASGDTSSIKPTSQDTSVFAKPADAKDHTDKAAVHHRLLADAYNYITTHKKETEVAVATASVAVATLALRHYLPAPVAEKITASGASILERTLGVAKAPNAVLEMKVLDAPEKVTSLIARLRGGEITSDILNVKNVNTGAEFKLLTGHSPIAPEATHGADFIATCDPPPTGKSIFANQDGPVYLKFDKPNQTLRFSETPEPFSQRIGRFLRHDQESWVPLGTQPGNGLRALEADRAAMARLENVNAATAQTDIAARETIAKWESQQRIINRNADKQDYASNLIRNELLPELQRSGLVSKDWKFFSTQLDSAFDDAGGDGVFVNQVTKQAHLIDYSTSPFKRIRPVGESPNVRRAGITERTEADKADFADAWAGGLRDKKIAAVKTQGLIGFDNHWFDISGKLDVEIAEAAQFRKDLADHLTDLTHAPAYFKVGKTPFPEIIKTTPEIQIKQMEDLKNWSLAEAAKPDSLHRTGYREYADAVEKAITHKKVTTVAAGDATQFGIAVQQAADQSIFRWAVDKLGQSVVVDAKATARAITKPLSAVAQSESNLTFVREKGILRFDHDGLSYQSDSLTGQDGVLDRSRRNLLQQGRVKELFDDMSPKQKNGLLARLGTPGRPATEDVAVRQISRVLVEHNNEIKAGGQVGLPARGSTPPLIERIHQRLQIQGVSTLKRPLDIPAAAKLDPKDMPRMQ